MDRLNRDSQCRYRNIASHFSVTPKIADGQLAPASGQLRQPIFSFHAEVAFDAATPARSHSQIDATPRLAFSLSLRHY